MNHHESKTRWRSTQYIIVESENGPVENQENM